MSYAIYKTDAIIMRVIHQGEANVDVVFLTREFGKILARGQSSRKSESKMRMHLTRYNHVVIDVVRGKAIWRLTGISQVAAHMLFEHNPFLLSVHRMMRLAEFLIQGEEAHPELFDFFVALFEYVDTRVSPPPVTKHEAEGLELYGVIKTLEKLGYWNGTVLPEVPNPETLEACRADRKELVRLINESISMTQIVLS